MKVSGFTIVRNAVKFGYPFEESIRSLLPLVDELVIAVGDSDDGTWDLVTRIDDPKLKPFPTVWDETKRQGGSVLADQTNLALDRCTGDWAVYLQGDEVLHEREIETIRKNMLRHLDQATEGLSFLYLHFYGSFSLVQDNWCRWYRREVRAVKTGKGIVSVGDAAGFKVEDGGRLRRLIRADAGARVFHYGWVRPPGVMVEKRRNTQTWYYGDEEPIGIPDVEYVRPEVPYGHLGHLIPFNGSHPAVMAKLIAEADWTFDSKIDEQQPRWLRYLGLLVSCPRDSLRILVSRLMLTWNTHVVAPKVR